MSTVPHPAVPLVPKEEPPDSTPRNVRRGAVFPVTVPRTVTQMGRHFQEGWSMRESVHTTRPTKDQKRVLGFNRWHLTKSTNQSPKSTVTVSVLKHWLASSPLPTSRVHRPRESPCIRCCKCLRAETQFILRHFRKLVGSDLPTIPKGGPMFTKGDGSPLSRRAYSCRVLAREWANTQCFPSNCGADCMSKHPRDWCSR